MKIIQKGMTIIITVTLMLCILGSFSIGTATEPIDIEMKSGTGGEEPLFTGVQRTVMLEEFTFITCHFCHELADGINGGTGLYGTVDSYGFDQIAPLWIHTSGGGDPMFIRNPQPALERFYNYYGASANPYTWIDGSWRVDSEEGVPEDPEIHAWFDERLPIPANISISSMGSISGNNGSVTVSIEAVNDINITDLVLQCAIWEDHIQIDPRFYDPIGGDPPPGSPPSGEFRFACWKFIPDPLGTPIWPNGAKRWDTLEITQNFTLDPTWNVDTSNLGISISIQSVSSQLVEQAHVEDFGNFGNHEPWVDLTFPSGQDQILSGTETITWSATDLEDADPTLDITLEYSPDFGSSWVVLESGFANNDGTITWDTTSVTDGTDYILRITATDSGAEVATRTFRQPFSIDNTQDDEWFFQANGPSNLDLDMKPCEKNLTELMTMISAQGQVQVGSWETSGTFTDGTIDGPWTFNVNGYLSNDGFDAYLYAKVFASSDMGTPLDTTVSDDENVGLFQTSHLFTWTDALVGIIPNGDSIVIELWLDVYAGKSTTFESILSDFNSGTAGWSANHWSKQNLNAESWQTSGGNPGGWVGVNYWYSIGGPEPLPDNGGYWESAFEPTGNPQNVMLNFDWICSQYGAANTADVSFYVFIDPRSGTPTIGTEVWTTTVNAATSWSSVGPLDISAYVTSASTYYLKVGVWEVAVNKQTLELAGFDNVQISWDTTESIFVMETDYADTQSGVLPSLGSTYSIGPLDVGWNFISTPLIPVDNTLPTVFLDLDGDTTWNLTQHYDMGTWSSWSTFKPPALNDLTSVNVSIGVWLYIEAGSLGDGFIKVGGTEPASTVIDLKAGWNMVGYPATDDSTYDVNALIADTGATGIEGFNPAAPYHIEVLAGNYVLKRGEAYWVKVDSDTTWTVNW